MQASSLALALEGFVFWGYSMLLNEVKRRGEAKLLHHCYNKVQKELYVAERSGVVGWTYVKQQRSGEKLSIVEEREQRSKLFPQGLYVFRAFVPLEEQGLSEAKDTTRGRDTLLVYV